MKKYTVSFQVRLASVMILVSSLLSSCLIYGLPPDPFRMTVCLVTAICSISMFPVSDGRAVLSLWNSAALLMLFAACLFLHLPALASVSVILVYSLTVLLLLAVRPFLRPGHVAAGPSAWTALMNYSRLLCMCLLLGVLCLGLLLLPLGWPGWLVVALLAAFYVFMHMRAFQGRTFLVSEKKAVEIRRPYPIVAMAGQTGGHPGMVELQSLYHKAVALMESGRPYLNPDFSAEALAEALGVDRNHLSQAVSECAGKTFPQFVNSFRVKYAESVIRGDPKMRMRDVAARAGYNNPVTFSLAFKNIHGVNPGEYAQEISLRALRSRPSRKQGPER